MRGYLKGLRNQGDGERVKQHDERARTSVQNMAIAKFPVVKMAGRNSRTVMCSVRFITVRSAITEPSIVMSNTTLWETYLGRYSVNIDQRKK